MEQKTITQSTKWSAISELLSKLVGPISNILLARLLVPEVFGLVATFTLVTTFAEVFTDAGFQKYLVQHEFENEDEREKYTNVAFWTNLGFSFLVWVLITIFRNPIAEFVGSPGYGIEISVLSFQIPLHAFSSIQTALYRRDFRFKQLVPIKFITSFMPIFVTVPLAAIFKNCWAIIVGNLAKQFISALLLTFKSLWKPRLYYSISKLREMLSDCLWLMADSFMIWLTAYAGTLITGRYLDDYYTGIYKIGETTINPYIDTIFAITSPVLFSALSRLQNEKKECDKVFLDYQKYVAYLVIPLGVAAFVYRDAITLILLGENWMEASILIGTVGFTLSFSSITGRYNSIYFRAMGKPRIALLVQSTYAIILTFVLIWAVNQPFTVLSYVRGSLGLVYALISVIVLWVIFKISFLKTLKNILPSITGSLIFAVISYLMKDLFGGVIWWQIISGFIGILIYVAVLILIPSSRKDLSKMKFAKKVISKIQKRKGESL